MRPRDQALLTDLGHRLRDSRQAAHLSLAELARRAEVSRRYLTEAEGGRANPSLLVLARLADALEVPLVRLMAETTGSRPAGRVALLGLRGAGKSTVGRALALALEAPFVELDARVEELAGLSLSEIFELHGPETFRRLESEALETVLARGGRLVLATGGSVVTRAKTFARLRETCTTVWLRADPEDHFNRVLAQGDRRPMRGRPQAMDELRALLAEREPLYAACRLACDTSGAEIDDVVSEIRSQLGARSDG